LSSRPLGAPDIEREETNVSFCTVVNCIDGRTQLPVIAYLQSRTGARYVDSVTEPGPVRILGEPEGTEDEAARASILRRVAVSVERHGSGLVAVVGHTDCGGNPAGEAQQMVQLERSVDVLAAAFPTVQVLGLWVDEDWTVSERFVVTR
jgi:hypothetical protein